MNNKDIKRDFAIVIRNAKITAFIFFILLTPNIVVQIKDLTELWGISKDTWFNAAFAGFVIYLAYVFFLWKCPSCNQYPGRGWFRKNCEKCGVELS